jgi:mannose-6-phosphate isomerase-like protein (cupin superfamily)
MSMNAESARTSRIALHISLAAAVAAPLPAGRRSAELLRHGTLELRWDAPSAIGLDHDPQPPHASDEVSIVAAGTGRFVRGEESAAFGPGDVLFVPARIPHRFE